MKNLMRSSTPTKMTSRDRLQLKYIDRPNCELATAKMDRTDSVIMN